MDISEVVKRSGVPASTLRFYEEKGLIQALGRQGIRRQFAASVLERLALIALGRAAGFSLDEIARMFGDDGRPEIDREQLLHKAEELDRTIVQLTAMRDGLRHAASTLRDELSAYSQPAAADAAATAAELLAECGRSHSDVAEKADRHAHDAVMLHEGWPRQPEARDE